jgi:hypothetical protein
VFGLVYCLIYINDVIGTRFETSFFGWLFGLTLGSACILQIGLQIFSKPDKNRAETDSERHEIKSDASESQPRALPFNRMVVSVFGCIVLYALLIPHIGYFPSTVIFVTATMLMLGTRSFWLLLLGVGILSVAAYVSFVQILKISIGLE